jgi:hypothetical protein
MSVEFRDQGFPGWFQDNPNNPTILRANITQLTSKSGGISPIVAEFNYGDGSITYSEVRGGIGFNGPRIPLFTQSASGARTILNQGNLNNLKPEDIARIESSVKPVAFRANQTLANDREKETLRNSPYYKSQSNAERSGTGLSNIPPGEGTGAGSPNDQQSSSGGDGESTVDLSQLSTIKSGYARESYGDDIRYPDTLKSNKQDVIKFTMYEYNPTLSFTGTGDQSAFSLNRGKQTGAKRGSVVLPIQPTITDTNSVSWQQDSLNPLELAAINASSGFIESGPDGLSKVLGKLSGDIQKEGGNAQTAVKAGALSLAIGKNLLARTTGAILNPNVELLFNAPSLRVFNYSFKLSARNQDDSRAIQKIIRFFKQGMSVQRSPAELFLVTPDIFQIQYLFKERDHPYINRIKTCALTNCSVDYTPTGSYMTFKDGSMVSYTVNLTFEELEPVYHDDYKTIPETEIGY